jgi:hypothetical protein
MLSACLDDISTGICSPDTRSTVEIVVHVGSHGKPGHVLRKEAELEAVVVSPTLTLLGLGVRYQVHDRSRLLL